MLIGLHYNKDLRMDEWSEIASQLIPHVHYTIGKSDKLYQFPPSQVHVYQPRTLEDYTQLLKEYKPAKTEQLVIFVSTHHTLVPKDDIVTFRYLEYIFDRKGGTLWGDKPETPSEPMTYIGQITNIQQFDTMTRYRAMRAKDNLKLTTRYFGRGSVDPHTLVFGLSIDAFQRSKLMDTMILSLPETDNWWQGVGFFMNHSVSRLKALEHLEHVRTVSMSAKSHEKLELIGVEHNQFVLPELRLSRKFGQKYTDAYGIALQHTVETASDNHNWTFRP